MSNAGATSAGDLEMDARESAFLEWWYGLPDGWPVTEPWKRVAKASWLAACEFRSGRCSPDCLRESEE